MLTMGELERRTINGWLRLSLGAMSSVPRRIGKRGKRDVAETERALEVWLARRLGVGQVIVSDLSIPRAGFSNETLMLRATWDDERGAPRTEGFVVRIEPSEHQVFLTPDVMFQARMMTELACHPGVPVPEVWFTEEDPEILGARFFLMGRIDGQIPPDLPSWHERGWVTELQPDERARLYDNALAAMGALHQIDWRDGFEFLAWPNGAGPLAGYLGHVGRWYEWSASARTIDADVIAAAFSHVMDDPPADDVACITWGDARVGNVIFARDLSVAAMLDWEGAALGTPGIDVGWWLMFEEFLSEAKGVARLAGVPGRDATLARYSQLTGNTLSDPRYYEILAGLVFALINSRLAELLIGRQMIDPQRGREFVTRVTTMLAHWLEFA